MAVNGEAPRAENITEKTLDQLCNGEKGYVCDQVAELVEGPVNNQVDWLKERVGFIFQSIEMRGKQIEEFYIGKTYAKEKKSRIFDAMDRDTWKMKGIQDRCGSHNREKHYNGLIILTVVTKEMLPRNPENENEDDNQSHTNQQDYAIMLEQRLLHYYKIESYDKRIKNETFGEGRKAKMRPGFIVYVAVKLKENIGRLNQPFRDMALND